VKAGGGKRLKNSQELASPTNTPYSTEAYPATSLKLLGFLDTDQPTDQLSLDQSIDQLIDQLTDQLSLDLDIDQLINQLTDQLSLDLDMDQRTDQLSLDLDIDKLIDQRTDQLSLDIDGLYNDGNPKKTIIIAKQVEIIGTLNKKCFRYMENIEQVKESNEKIRALFNGNLQNEKTIEGLEQTLTQFSSTPANQLNLDIAGLDFIFKQSKFFFQEDQGNFELYVENPRQKIIIAKQMAIIAKLNQKYSLYKKEFEKEKEINKTITTLFSRNRY